MGHSPWGCKESNATEHKHTHTCKSYTFLHPFVFKFLSLYEFSLSVLCLAPILPRSLHSPQGYLWKVDMQSKNEVTSWQIILNVIRRHSSFRNFPENAHLLGRLSRTLSPFWVTLNSGSSFSSKLLPEIKQTICE